MLALPAERNPRTLAHARMMRERHPDPARFAREVMAMFRSEFSYSLEPPPLGGNAVDEFLFDTLTGYCEHYASAYATLLRAGGVPARVVLGYYGGYYNAIGGYLVVRRSDAHAWVEYWLADRGWVRADPTSMVAPERIDRSAGALGQDSLAGLRRGSVMNWLWTRWDYMELRWNDWVVNFQAIDQSRMLKGITDLLPRAPRLLGLLAVIAVTALLFFVVRQLRRQRRPAPARDPLARWLQRLRSILAGAGIDSTDAEPVSQLQRRAVEVFPEHAALLGQQVARYQYARYAASPSAGPGRWELAELWLKLRLSRLKRWPGRHRQTLEQDTQQVKP